MERNFEDMDKQTAGNLQAGLHAIGDMSSGRVCFMANRTLIMWRGKGLDCSPSQKRFTETFIAKLNKEAWLDGVWAICWVDLDLSRAEYKRAVLVYMDKDKDVQFTIDIEDSPAEMVIFMDAYVDQAMEAWKQWADWIKAVGVKPEEKIMAAKGQKSADPTAFAVDALSL